MRRLPGGRAGAEGMVAVAAVAILYLTPPPAGAQDQPVLRYGARERFDAASQLLVLGVQQAISDLPPSSGQTFTYTYDAAIDAYVRGDRVGPTSFFAPETIGKGTFDVRVAGSYFEIGQSFRPIDYQVTGADGSAQGFTKAGLDVSARVGVVSIAATYGILSDLDVSVTVPVTIVDANASISITTCQPAVALRFCNPPPDPNPPINEARVVAVVDRSRIDAPEFLRGEDPSIYQRSGSATAFGAGGAPTGFEEGTHPGLGRIAIAAKKGFQGWSILRAAVFGQVSLPSPSQDEFAGSDSTGLMARAIAAADVSEAFRILVDAGYEYDTEFDQLSRFVWDFGGALSLPSVTLDAGVGGSVYDEPIAWTPSFTSTFVPQTGSAITLTALQDNEVGTVYVAARAGARVRLGASTSLSGTVTVPLDDDTFSPDAVGTLALDVAF